MSHIQQTITLLEQELEVTQGRCHELTRAIETLRPLAGDVDEPAPRAAKTKAAKKAGRTARVKADTDQGEDIVAMLKKHGGAMKPGELARALKLEVSTVRYQVKPLIKSGAVIATGKTMNRQFSLPPRGRAAKEAP